jgi:hypothetical protein
MDFQDTFISEDKGSLSIHMVINDLPILSFIEVKVVVSRNSKEYFLYPDSSPIASHIYTSSKPEEPNSSFPFPPYIDIPYSSGIFPKLPSSHLEVVKMLVV